jgi:predicted GIY-YIG superfamily endonuclease
MIRDICSRSISSIVVPFLRLPLATTVAIAALASIAQANSMDRAILLEETPDRIVSDEEMPLDALGYLGGLFEARFYQSHLTTDDPRDEIREAAALYGLDLAMMMSIAKVESDFDPRVKTGSYKGLFQLSDYEFKKYGDGTIWDARDNARAAAHMFLVQAEKFRWALGHYPDYAERYMVHQQGIQGAIEHYTHPERIAWQSMCATDEGVLKGERWCKKCIWGNLLPEWKRGFGDVDNILSGDFVSLWTGRIDHLANRFSLADSGVSVSPHLRTHARRAAKLAHSNQRAPRPHPLKVHISIASAGPALPVPTIASIPHNVAAPLNSSRRTAKMPTRPGQAGAAAARRATNGSVRLQKQAAAVLR